MPSIDPDSRRDCEAWSLDTGDAVGTWRITLPVLVLKIKISELLDAATRLLLRRAKLDRMLWGGDLQEVS